MVEAYVGEDACSRLLNLLFNYNEVRKFSASRWFEVRELSSRILLDNGSWRSVEGLRNTINEILEHNEHIQELLVFDRHEYIKGDEEYFKTVIYYPGKIFIRKFCARFI